MTYIPRRSMPRWRLALASALALTLPAAAAAAPISSLVLSEVLFDPKGNDDGREWVELYNGTASDIDLSAYSLGWGGPDYTTGVAQLSGTITAGGTFVVGGPISKQSNGNPVYDQVFDFDPNLENAEGGVADGVALFDVLAADLTASTVPLHAVIYGTTNSNGLIDETGGVGAIDVGTGKQGVSIEFLGDAGWVLQPAPSPGARQPEPTPALLVAMGLVALATLRRNPTLRRALG